MAGALGLSIGGPRLYNGALANVRWIGEGRQEATPADIRRALELYRAACVVQSGALLVLSFHLHWHRKNKSRNQKLH